MSENLGKKFEGIVREQFSKYCYVLRLYDTTNGFLNISNPCDFITYDKKHMFMLECKSCHGASLPLSNISQNQRDSLVEASKYNIIAGYLVWFIDKDITIFIRAEDLETYILETGRKSLACDESKYSIKLNGTKKRKFFDYDIEQFLKEVTCD